MLKQQVARPVATAQLFILQIMACVWLRFMLMRELRRLYSSMIIIQHCSINASLKKMELLQLIRLFIKELMKIRLIEKALYSRSQFLKDATTEKFSLLNRFVNLAVHGFFL
ncbi:hypothetical protein B7992_01965 [Fibrobacter sp. UWH1]|nr:hypothetical protein B7992_01965 [Fibrobacter sp. UWH1]